jgi:hypothetical protein
MNTIKTETATDQYNNTIVRELTALNDVLREDSRKDGSLPEWLRLLEELELDCDTVRGNGGIFLSWLELNTLNLSIRIDTRGVEYGATIDVTRTLGGPTCWIRHDTTDGDTIEVTTTSGSERSTVALSLSYVAAELDALAW